MKTFAAIILLLFASAVLPSSLMAQWSTLPSVDNSINTLKTSPGANFASCSDGNGGAFYTFIKNSVTDGNPDVYVNRIDKNGVVRFGAGISLNNSADNQGNPDICEDGHGGCYVAYENVFSVPGNPVFVQHFDSLGTKLWAGNGVRALTIDNGLGQSVPSLANNNGNGVFLTVQNTVFGGADGLHSQKLSFNGVKQWGAGGRRVIVPGYERNPETVGDGNGGVMIIWFSAYQLRAQHLNASGQRLYDTANYFLSTESISGNYKLIRDTSNRFIAVWFGDHSDGSGSNIYAQKINISGAKLWGANPKVICDTTGHQTFPDVLSDNSGGAYISWCDGRATDAAFFAQRLNSNGVKQWQKQGVALYTGGALYPQNYLVPDLNNGAKVFFQGIDVTLIIKMQSLNLDGTKNAPAQGIAISNPPGIGISLPNRGGVVAAPGGEAIVFNELYQGQYQEMHTKKVPQGCISGKPVIRKITTSCGPNSATMNWPGHLFSTFEVRYKIASAGTWTTIGNIGRDTSYIFANLQPNTAYKFQLRAKCDLDNSYSQWANKDKITQNCALFAGNDNASNITTATTGQLKIYPNPASKSCVVSFGETGGGKLKLFDAGGNIIYQAAISAGQKQTILDVSAFAAGVYVCRLEMQGKSFMQRLVVVR